MVRIYSSIGHFHGQPAFNSVQAPEIVMALQEVITPFAQLFLLHTAHDRSHDLLNLLETLSCVPPLVNMGTAGFCLEGWEKVKQGFYLSILPANKTRTTGASVETPFRSQQKPFLRVSLERMIQFWTD